MIEFDQSQNVERVRLALPHGRDNAITVERMAGMLYVSTRIIKRCIQLLRMEGVPIISSSSGGYFLPDRNDPDDIAAAQKFLHMQEQQAKQRFVSSKPVKRWLAEIGQTTMKEVVNG